MVSAVPRMTGLDATEPAGIQPDDAITGPGVPATIGAVGAALA